MASVASTKVTYCAHEEVLAFLIFALFFILAIELKFRVFKLLLILFYIIAQNFFKNFWRRYFKINLFRKYTNDTIADKKMLKWE